MSNDSDQGRAITSLLARYHSGDESVRERLFELVYDELRVIAHAQLRRQAASETINTTALVHEAYINIARARDAQWEDRARFFGFAARVMRNILVDYARARAAAKRQSEEILIMTDGPKESAEQKAVEILALDTALRELERHDQRLARVVECRFFGGMTSEETADALTVSLRTVERDWSRARAYLYRELTASPAGLGIQGSPQRMREN